MQINNVNIYGLEESIIASGFPMFSKELTNADFEKQVYELKHLLKNKKFIQDFINYQDNYNKFKTKEDGKCEFCGSSLNVQGVNFSNSKHYLCSKHSHQYYKYGEVFETTPKYELFDNYVQVTIIGDCNNKKNILISYKDLEYFFYNTWHIGNNKGYVYNSNNEVLHRLLLNVKDKNLVVDHINKNQSDNRRNNLRVCSYQENSRNSNINKNSSTNITGVSFDKQRNKYRSYITLDSKQLFLGRFNNKEDAIVSRLQAEANIYGDFAPQRHLFEAYDINFKPTEYIDDSISFKNSIKHYKRILKLANAPVGSGHDAALKGIVVQFNCHAPQYFWQQLQRYHFIDIISSMSKMHRINKMGLTDACMEETNYEAIYNANEAINYYDAGEIDIDSVLANVPMGLEYTARLTTNYLQLKTIYKQRKNHRSKQWKVFCEWIKTLPLAEELIINEDSTSQKL